MLRQWIVGTALALVAVAAVAPGVASADPKTILPITFDCGSVGEFVYAGKIKGPLLPMGELDGHKVKLSDIFVEVSSFSNSGFIVATWPVPKNPNLTAVTCVAYYPIPGDPNDPFGGLFVNGWAVIHVRS